MEHIQKIHLIFKTHLDVGFTSLARNVVDQYFERDIPLAIRLAEDLRQAGGPEGFVWTTGSWLIYEYLERAAPTARDRLEKAIWAGDITWHGLPFTTHSELMDPDLFQFGLSLSQTLDHRFDRRTIAAKMTDVPGHTRAIVPLLQAAGIQFLHIGVNPASTPPDVPPVFRWVDPDGAEVVVMYHKGSYGDLMALDGLDEAIAFAHTGDNLGPQSPDQIRAIFARMQERFPGVQITASTMDAFAAKLMKLKDRLPVITQEIGDTWIHGAGTDPFKVAWLRELLRMRRRWLAEGKINPKTDAWRNFHRSILLVPEHTWGLDLKTHLLDYESYNRPEFEAARRLPNFQEFESSWKEQRDYLHAAVDALPSNLKQEVDQARDKLHPVYPDLSSFQEVKDVSARFEAAHFTIGFQPQTGAVDYLAESGSTRSWADSEHCLALFCYQAFSQADYERFYRQYIINKSKNWIWAWPDFAKPGLEESSAKSQDFLPHLSHMYHRSSSSGQQFVLDLTMPEEAWKVYGSPRRLFLEVDLPDQSPELNLRLTWFEKPASRLPEALWLSFSPLVKGTRNWIMDKLGQPVSPLDVIRNGNRKLHALGSGLRWSNQGEALFVETLDAPLVAPGERSLLDFNNRQPLLRKGFHFCLYNNIWGTNFPMWYEEDGTFRFNLYFLDQDT